MYVNATPGWKAAPLAGCERVPVKYTGKEDGEKLPRRHDGGKEQGSVALYGVDYEQLACIREM